LKRRCSMAKIHDDETTRKQRVTGDERLRVKTPAELPTEAPGLCRTCDHAATCTLPRAESGVWHCEEFA